MFGGGVGGGSVVNLNAASSGRRSIARIQIPSRSRVCVKIRRSYSMYGSIGTLPLPLCPPRSVDPPRYRVARLSNIAVRRFLRCHVYPAVCRMLAERGERERGREGESKSWRPSGRNILHVCPLKKQIWYSTRLDSEISITEQLANTICSLPCRVPVKDDASFLHLVTLSSLNFDDPFDLADRS